MMSQFDPNNKIVQLCIQGMAMEENGKPDEAGELFLNAWKEASDDFEKFLAAYFVSRHQKSTLEELEWLEMSLQLGLKLNTEATKSALPTLYANLATCYEALGNPVKAKQSKDLSQKYQLAPSDAGPFYHGTKADLEVGDYLTAGGESNYQSELKMNHIYFTALIKGAGLAAAMAKGEGRERVYIVEPTGTFENDPNVTDKKFPGNLTRSFRSQEPLKIVGEVIDWERQMPEELQKWREKLSKIKGEIIN